MILISECLIGNNVKYNGKNNFNEIAKKLFDEGQAVIACPEVLGGLPIPRTPAEIKGGKVISLDGVDVTDNYSEGAQKTLEIAQKYNVEFAILQERSPSCGVHKIYDGTFSNTLISGMGKTTELLEKHGIKVITIEEYMKIYNKKI